MLKKTLKKIKYRAIMWSKFPWIFKDYIKFKSLDLTKRCPVSFTNVYPCLWDKTKNTPFEKQYVYHLAWAARCLEKIRPTKHSDFGALIYFPTVVSAFIPVDFYDYRPAQLQIEGLNSKFANLTDIPIQSNSLESVSCLHTIEHVGLGRYGDPIDPDGDLKALRELQRIVSVGGSLLLVVPLGHTQLTEFNGHRIYEYEKFVSYIDGFELVDFTYIPQDFNKNVIYHTNKEAIGSDRFGCGCFWFRKIKVAL